LNGVDTTTYANSDQFRTASQSPNSIEMSEYTNVDEFKLQRPRRVTSEIGYY